MANESLQELLDAHKRLGLKLSSSDSEVKSAYRKQAFASHPDRKGVSPQAGEGAFKQVQRDYETIRGFRDVHRAAQQAAAAAPNHSASAAERTATSTARAAGAAQATAAGQKAAGEGKAMFRYGRSGILGTIGAGALLIGAGLLIETVKYKYVKPQIENSKIVRRISSYAGYPEAGHSYMVPAPVESSSHTHEARTV